MHLTFTVLCKEPLTPEESKAAELGITPDPRPILDRWANRSPWNRAMFDRITYVEDPTHKSDSGLPFGESVSECMDRIEKRDKQNAKAKNSSNRANHTRLANRVRKS